MDEYLGQNIKVLGFGLMRLPMDGKQIDLEQTKQMADEFIKHGFSYFDTAYVYIEGKSEEAVKEVLVDRYPREAFQIATKMPLWDVKGDDYYENIFSEQLKRTGAGYFDFYLLHGISKAKLAMTEETGAWEFCLKKKAQGLIKHLGFSFHDTTDVIDTILARHPETEFVQLQINYMDWEDAGVQSRLCYEVARKHNKPVVIMEPVKGGMLSNPNDEIKRLFEAARPGMSASSWAMRFAASLEGVITVLSGMSSIEQMRDNISYMTDFEPLIQSDRDVLARAVEIFRSIPTIQCTACRYCTDGCPQKINIPQIIKTLNGYTTYKNLTRSKGQYGFAIKGGGKAGDCITCGDCEAHCPQKLPIIEHMQEASGLFDGGMMI